MYTLLQKSAVRLLWLFVVLLSATTGPVWLIVLLAGSYIVLYRGIELLVIAFLIDAYFGIGMSFPYVYTVAAGIGLFLMQCAAANISVYNSKYVS